MNNKYTSDEINRIQLKFAPGKFVLFHDIKPITGKEGIVNQTRTLSLGFVETDTPIFDGCVYITEVSGAFGELRIEKLRSINASNVEPFEVEGLDPLSQEQINELYDRSFDENGNLIPRVQLDSHVEPNFIIDHS